MKFLRKYKIVTDITKECKIDSQNPKYFAKYINDNIGCFGNTEKEAIENLKKLYIKHKRKNKLCSPFSEKVLDRYVSIRKSEKYFSLGLSMNFFELIGEDPYSQIDDECTVQDFELNPEQIAIVNSTYKLNIQPEDILVDIFEQIKNSCA